MTSSWKGFWGQRDDDCIYVGMWTRHLLPGSNKRLSNVNRLIGFNYKGVFAATFLNSHKDRSYTLGLQRIILSKKLDHYMQVDLGYRFGLIWGYKGNSPIASAKSSIPGIENLNPIPFVQIIGNFSWEIVGVQVSYCWAVFTLGFFVKF